MTIPSGSDLISAANVVQPSAEPGQYICGCGPLSGLGFKVSVKMVQEARLEPDQTEP